VRPSVFKTEHGPRRVQTYDWSRELMKDERLLSRAPRPAMVPAGELILIIK
jgi:hypothetical protein